jgi:hypothetical protein
MHKPLEEPVSDDDHLPGDSGVPLPPAKMHHWPLRETWGIRMVMRKGGQTHGSPLQTAEAACGMAPPWRTTTTTMKRVQTRKEG